MAQAPALMPFLMIVLRGILLRHRFRPPDLDWPAADHPPKDSLYVWGPPLPEDFVANLET